MKEKLNFNEFLRKLDSTFSKYENLKVDYSYLNSFPPTKIETWLYTFLAPLSISEFSFEVINHKLTIKSYKYDSTLNFEKSPFEIELIDNTNEFIPDNIKTIKIKKQQ